MEMQQLNMISLSTARSRVTLYTLTCLLFTALAFGQICNSATSCTECIKLSLNCVWCAQANYSQPGQRCVERTSSDANSCTMIEDPRGDATIAEARNFGGNDFVQVSPQRFHLNLRPGEPQTVQVGIRSANNYPLDIYYLMDLSLSMSDDLQSLQTFASQLATTISNITTNFQIGFGSFVDKEVVPFIAVETARLVNPCITEGTVCRPAFSTQHLLNLTNDTDQFVDLIQAATISGNLDIPEGGFDALLQVIVCQEIVGWRQNARHFIVFLTDAEFHFGGDGKLGGAVIPHDGKCYLERNGSVYIYTRSKELDYPSVGQINHLLQQFDIIPIFATEARAQPFYENLRSVITNAYVETLASDSSNIVDLIQNVYYAISQTVRLDPDRVTGVTVDVTPNCPSGSSVDGNTCTGLLIGQLATFNVTVTTQLCTQELIDGRNLNVKIPGFGEFVMELNGLCDCNCTNNPEVNSTYCNDRNGSLVCGQCICNEGWVGDTCECDASNISITACPLGANNVTCTSAVRGTCVCSTCVCNEEGRGRYFGSACECDNFSCDKDHRGLACGGTDRGICGCDQSCTCLPGWSGMTCDCNLSTAPCVSPFGQICSERGTCVCGECICDEPELSGAFCEICTGNNCPEKPECLAFQECAICETFPNDLNCSDVNCTTERVGGVDTATYRIDGTLRTSFCRVTRGDCAYQYFVGTRGGTYTSEDTAIEVMEADCGTDEEGMEFWIVIVSILGGLTLLTLIVLVIIRIIIELRYYIEFRQWRKELEDSRFAKIDNPLYQGATEEFLNPAYGK